MHTPRPTATAAAAAAATVDDRRVRNEGFETRPVAHKCGVVLQVHQDVGGRVLRRVEDEHLGTFPQVDELDDELRLSLERCREATPVDVAEEDDDVLRSPGFLAPDLELVCRLGNVQCGKFASGSAHHILHLSEQRSRLLA